ncbi:MAG: tetratricopeptide repeat protein [Candidatus Paceibacterota bacterium]|jgi:tetratricopeptide (TPR) repeat protein
MVSKFQDGKLANISRTIFLFVIFLTPLFFLPLTILPVEINKQYMALFLVIFSFTFYLLNAISTKTIIFPRSIFAILVLAVFVSVGISAAFSDAKTVSFFGNLYQSDSLMSFLVYFIAFIISSTLFRKKDFVFIGIAFIAGIVPVLILSLLQMRGYFYLPFEFAKNAGFNIMGMTFDFGFFISFALVLIIAILSEFKLTMVPKIVLAMTGLLILSNLIILNQRFLWAAISVAMLFVVARKFSESIDPHEPHTASSQKIGRMEIPLLVMIISFLLFVISVSLPPFADLPVQVKPNLSSTLDVVKYNFSAKNIMIGSGPSTFGYAFSSSRPIELNNTDFWSVRFIEGYSFLSTAISTFGILGAALLAFLVIYLAVFLIRNGTKGKLFPISLGILFLAAGWFVFNSFFVQMLAIFIGLGLISTLSRTHSYISLERTSKSFSFIIFIIIVVCITGNLAILLVSSQKYAAAVYYQKGLEASSIDDALKNLDLAIKLDPDSDLYLRTASQSLILGAKNEASKEDKTAPDILNARIQNDIALAVQVAQKATVINPADSLNWANLANVYEQIIPIVDGSDLFAENNYKQALKRDPKNFELEFALARTLLTSADKIKLLDSQKENKEGEKLVINSVWSDKLDQAMSALERSIALNGNYAPAHFQIAMIFMRENEVDKAIQKLEETKNIAPYDSGLAYQLGAIYYDKKEIARAQFELERAVALNDKYSNARYLLGLIFDEQGKKDLAIEQFKKISELNPDNEDIKKILSNLKQGKPIAEEKQLLPMKEEVPGGVLENIQSNGIGEQSGNGAELLVETPK